MSSIFSYLKENQKRESTGGKFNPEDDETLIDGALAVPFQQIRNCYRFNNDYTQADIENRFHQLIKQPKSPKRIYDSVQKPEIQIPWDIEEDYWIYTFITNNNSLTPEQIFQYRCSNINPIRSRKEVLERIEQIRLYSKEDIDKLLDNMAKRIATDKFIFESLQTHRNELILSQYKCKTHEEPKLPFSRDFEIQELESLLPMITTPYFNGSELAIFLSEKSYFRMVNSRVSIGYRRYLADVNIDLSILSDTDCTHISSNQAIISFLCDYQFYIENTGSAIFRVNGTIIPPASCAHVPDYAILDFCGILYTFIINKEKVKEVKQKYEEILEKKQMPNESLQYHKNYTTDDLFIRGCKAPDGSSVSFDLL